MMQARNRLLISLVVLLIAGAALELSAQTPVDWVKLTSQPDGFEVAVPRHNVLVLRTEDRTELAGGTKDASISISIRKQVKANKQVRQMRSGSDQSVIRETAETNTSSVKRFLIGPPSYLNEIIYIGTEDRIYVVSFDNEKDNPDLQKMRLSLKVGGGSLFKLATSDASVGMASINLDDLDTSPDVQSALGMQDAASNVISFGNVERDSARFDPKFDRRLFVLNRPNAVYTDSARRRGVQGTVLARVEFRADGTIGSILVDNRLDLSLATSAGQAARKIKFVPARIDGKPVTVFRIINYGFSIG